MAVTAGVVLGGSVLGQSGRHLNPMVDLLKDGKPVFGVQPPFGGGGGNRGGNRGGGGAAAGAAGASTTPPPAPVPARTPLDVAKDILAHPEVDYFFNGSMERAVDPALATFTQYADALVEAGAISRSPYHRLLAPLSVKTPKISTDPTKAVENISRQLNAGVASISFVHVDTAAELEQGIAAMRFKSRGGSRPDDIGQAAKYWGLTDAQYRAKADVWPLNPDGELVAWAIIETKEGLANVREIAQVKGLGVLIPGAGTLRGVFTTTTAEGQQVRDEQAWETAIQKILAACKEFKVACGYPASATDIEMRMKQGFSVFIIQSFSDAGFKAVEIGRQVSGRK
jgi:4-hydroxy-2-oxoheptanedioate aldolase